MPPPSTARHAPALPLRRAKAFTLIEVLIGVVVLLLIVLPAIASVTQSMRIIDKARDTTLASSMMQSVVEQLRMQTFATINANYCGSEVITRLSTDDPNSKLKELILNKEQFNFTQAKQFRMVGVFEKKSPTQIYVTLSASWVDMDMRKQSHSAFTVISEGGLSDNVNKGW